MSSIIYVLVPCFWVAWAISTGPVDHYEFFVDNNMQNLSADPEAALCLDLDGEAHSVHVVAVSAAGNTSPPSETLWVQRIYDCDADASGGVNIFDLFSLISQVGDKVLITDVFACIDKVGTCNSPNGIVEVECE